MIRVRSVCRRCLAEFFVPQGCAGQFCSRTCYTRTSVPLQLSHVEWATRRHELRQQAAPEPPVSMPGRRRYFGSRLTSPRISRSEAAAADRRFGARQPVLTRRRKPAQEVAQPVERLVYLPPSGAIAFSLLGALRGAR